MAVFVFDRAPTPWFWSVFPTPPWHPPRPPSLYPDFWGSDANSHPLNTLGRPTPKAPPRSLSSDLGGYERGIDEDSQSYRRGSQRSKLFFRFWEFRKDLPVSTREKSDAEYYCLGRAKVLWSSIYHLNFVYCWYLGGRPTLFVRILNRTT